MSNRKPKTPEQKDRENARKRTLPKVHPVECGCGWSNGPARSAGQAAYLVRRHQERHACGYPPPAPIRSITRPCALCEKPATHPDGLCDPCHKAEADHESPLDITGTGRWVVRRGVRYWQEAMSA